ncbi:MAG: AAA family ATPase [Acidobacteria bacterium]|nr:AAA family ATPase [Acidobacteriota bacterium]
MIHLKSIALKNATKKFDHFPFNIPVIRDFDELELVSPVTYFVGENGSGKSTLLEGIASGLNLPAVGNEDIERDATLAHARKLGKQLKFKWTHKTHKGFFLRAEDFFNFSRRLQAMTKELGEIAEGFESEYTGYALGLAKGSVLAQRRALVEKYGENPDANSHGESFLKLFQARFVPGGLYLLDEPEAPLSPQRQLALLAMIKDMVDDGAQFIIASHSPILMAYPGAVIYSFDEHPIKQVEYDDVEHVSLTRAFLNNPQSFLRHL